MPQAQQYDWEQKIDKLNVPTSVKADLWDAFELSSDQGDFKARLEAIQIDKSVKRDLWFTKFPELAPVAGYSGPVGQPPKSQAPAAQAPPATTTKSSTEPPKPQPGIWDTIKSAASLAPKMAAMTPEAIATTKMLPISGMAPQGEGRLASGVRGALQRVEDLSTGSNLAIGAGAAAVSALSAPVAAVLGVIGAGMGLASGASSYADAASDIARGDIKSAYEKVGSGTVDAFLGFLSTRAAVKSGELPNAAKWVGGLRGKGGGGRPPTKPSGPPPEAPKVSEGLLDSILEQAEAMEAVKSGPGGAKPAPRTPPKAQGQAPAPLGTRQPTTKGAQPSESGAMPTSQPKTVTLEKAPVESPTTPLLDQIVVAGARTSEPPVRPGAPPVETAPPATTGTKGASPVLREMPGQLELLPTSEPPAKRTDPELTVPTQTAAEPIGAPLWPPKQEPASASPTPPAAPPAKSDRPTYDNLKTGSIQEILENIDGLFRDMEIGELLHLGRSFAREISYIDESKPMARHAQIAHEANKVQLEEARKELGRRGYNPEIFDTRRPVHYVPINDLHVDPARFQFKTNVGAKGVTEELKEVGKWDPVAAGTIAVWRDPADGKLYVVNGHHRHELATRLRVPEMAVIQIEAANASEARGIGALLNMKEGRGTPVDAAKVIRDLGLTAADMKEQGVALKGPVAKEAIALSNLDPALFEMVWSGSLAPSRGALIGEMFGNRPADQKAILDIIKQAEAGGKRPTNDELREAIRFATADTPTTKESTDTLFGTIEEFRSLFVEKGELSDYVRKQLAQEKKIFGAVSDEGKAKRLEQSGNVIKAEDNRRIAEQAAQAMEVYDRLSLMAGPIRDTLNQGAQELAKGGDANETKQRVYEQVREAVAQELRGSRPKEDSGGSGPVDAGQQQEPVPPGDRGPSLFGEEGDRLASENAEVAKKDEEKLTGELLSAEFHSQRNQGQPPVDRGALFTGDIEPKGQQSLVSSEPPKEPEALPQLSAPLSDPPKPPADIHQPLKQSEPVKKVEPPKKPAEPLPGKESADALQGESQTDAKAAKKRAVENKPKVSRKTPEAASAEPPKRPASTPKDIKSTNVQKPEHKLESELKPEPAQKKRRMAKVQIFSIEYSDRKIYRIDDKAQAAERLRSPYLKRVFWGSGDDSGVLEVLEDSNKAKVQLDDDDRTEIVDISDRPTIPDIIAKAMKKLAQRREEPPKRPKD